jgi:hypothetical protein
VIVELHDYDLFPQDELRYRAVATHGSQAKGVGAVVLGARDAFGGSVELWHGVDAKSFLEALPDVGPEAASECEADVVGFVEVCVWINWIWF